MSVNNKTAIVTGTGSGIGQAIASQLAKKGAEVVLLDIDENKNNETESMIQSMGGAATAITCDVSDSAEVEAAIETTVERYDSIDILVNNAAISQNFQKVGEIDEKTWDQIQDVNLKGAFLCSKYSLPELQRGKSGVIINVSSTSALRPRLGLGAYVASKSGMVGLTKILALDYAESGVRVNTVCPVATDTPLFHQKRTEKEVEEVRDTIPLGRLNQPDDIANTVTFLSSDRASMITGVTLPVDGGRTI